jgi:hypothetical protein
MRRVGQLDLRQVENPGEHLAIERYIPERRAKRLDGRRRQTADRDVMRRPDHDDAPDARRLLPERGEGMAGNRPGVEVAGVRHDQGLGSALGARPVRRGEKALDLGAQACSLRRIESAGHGGWSNHAHHPASPVARIWPEAHLMWHAGRCD